MKNSTNPVVYFEIPVCDMKRAVGFYGAVFGFDFESGVIDDNEMAYFPFSAGKSGITGALARGKTYKSATCGTLVYFGVCDIDRALAQAVAYGGKILFPKTTNDGSYSVAEIEDSEGNRVGLHMTNK